VWIGELGIHYWLGVDGISIFLIGLTLLLTVGALWLGGLHERSRFSGPLILLVSSALVGCFTALDVLLAFTCLEVAIIALYFLLRCESGRSQGANWFLGLNLVGSAGLLICLLVLSRQAGGVSDLASLIARPLAASDQVRWGPLFLGSLLLLSGAVPFQMGLRLVARDSSPASLVLVLGLYLKVSLYFVVRLGFPLFPAAFLHYDAALFWLGVASLLVGGLLMLSVRNVAERLALLTVCYVGLMWCGLATLEVDAGQGALGLSIGHGLLMLLLGLIWHLQAAPDQAAASPRTNRLSQTLLRLSAVTVLAVPATALFAGLWLILVPNLQRQPWGSGLALAGFLFGSAVLAQWLWNCESLHLRPQQRGRIACAVVALVALIFIGGVQPERWLEPSRNAVMLWLAKVNPSIQVEGGGER